MARKVEVTLFDDTDGSAADETVRFGIDGASYEIDLNAANADKLRSALAQFILKGRRLGRDGGVVSRRTRASSAAPTRIDRAQNQAIRDWAKSRGLEVSDRGRIPVSVTKQYEAEAGR